MVGFNSAGTLPGQQRRMKLFSLWTNGDSTFKFSWRDDSPEFRHHLKTHIDSLQSSSQKPLTFSREFMFYSFGEKIKVFCQTEMKSKLVEGMGLVFLIATHASWMPANFSGFFDSPVRRVNVSSRNVWFGWWTIMPVVKGCRSASISLISTALYRSSGKLYNSGILELYLHWNVLVVWSVAYCKSFFVSDATCLYRRWPLAIRSSIRWMGNL